MEDSVMRKILSVAHRAAAGDRPDATATIGSTPGLLLAGSMAHDVGLGNVSDDAPVLHSFFRRPLLFRPRLHGWDASVGTIAFMGDPTHSALQILNERFAKGEIDQAEYEERRRALRS
jgi:hypothetical protein